MRGTAFSKSFKAVHHLCALLVILFAHSTFGQVSSSIGEEGAATLQLLSTEDGLSNRAVNDLTRDKNGLLWIATQNGLNRYDGHNYITYSNHPNNLNHIEDNWIWHVFRSQEGHLVLFTNSETIEVLNPETNVHQKLDMSATLGKKCAIRGLYQDIDESIYIIVENKSGYALLIYTDFDFNVVWEVEEERLATVEKMDKYSKRFHVSRDNAGFYWVLDEENGLQWRDVDGKLIRQFSSDDFDGLESDDPLPIGKNFMVQDGANRLWISFGNLKGVYNYDPITQKFARPAYLSQELFYQDAFSDEQGNVLFVCGEEKLTWSKIELLDSLYNVADLTNHFEYYAGWVRVVGEDFSKQLFYVHQVGVTIINFRSQVVKNYFSDLNSIGAVGQSIRGITQLDNSDILFATEDDGWFKISLVDDQCKAVTFDSKVPINLPNPEFSRNFAIDSHGNYWNSAYRKHILPETPGGYLLRYDQDNNSITSYESPYRCEHLCLTWDNQLCQVGNYILLLFDIESEKFTEYLNTDGSKPLWGLSAYTVIEGQDSLIWVGTDKGLVRIDRNMGTSKVINRDYKFNEGTLLSDNIIALYEDNSGAIWLGTMAGGFAIYNPIKDIITTYDKSNGLADNSVCGFITTDAINYWVATYNGLSYFDRESNAFQNFYTSDGFSHNEFNRCASYNDGKMIYFGGMNGINAFNEDELLQEVHIPELFLSTMTKGEASNLDPITLHYGIDKIKSIVIPATNKYLDIEMGINDYSNSGLNRYAYMLEGYDIDWQISNSNKVVFNNLPSGNYKLKLKGTNRRGQWSDIRSIDIRVKEFIYKSIWFYVSLLLVSLMGMYALFRYRLLQLNKILQLRTRIARDLHDDIGGILTGISMQSELLERDNLGKGSKRLGHIRELSQRAISSMRDVVWSIDNRHNKMEDLLDRMREYADEMLMPKGINYQIKSSNLREEQSLSIDVRQDLYFIFKEAVTNVIRHSEATEVNIELREQNHSFTMFIKDNGRGYDITNKSTGMGLSNIESRANNISAKASFENNNGFEVRIEMDQL